jgi:hypothetical protein
MGALSSFAVFDLTHHLLVLTAARRANFIGFMDYVIIGDDVCIANAQVAKEYSKLMEELGVKINLAKSIIFGAGLSVSGEIAKRTFISGHELSCIPVKLLAKLPKFGKLAPTVQDFMLSRGVVAPDRNFVNFMAGAVDSESLLTLLKLNAAPADIIGMITSFHAIAPELQVENWCPSIKLSDSDVIDAYTFTLISEQLKRLEALVRQTALIDEMTQSYFPIDFDEFLRKQSESDEKLRLLFDKLAKSGSLDSRHPMRVAALEEARRVGKILSGLRAGTISLSRVAKLGLLDSLRNSIWSKTLESDEERAQVLFSVFLSSVTALERITGAPTRSPDGRPIIQSLEFTIPILPLNRSFSVFWRLGQGVFVNMVRTRISTDTAENAAKVDSLLNKLTVVRPRSATKSGSA